MGKIALRNLAGVAVLLAAVVIVAGCGSSKKSSAPPVTVTVAPTTPATTTTAAATTTEQSTTTTATGASALKDCADLTTFGQEYGKALAATSGSGVAGLGPQADALKAFASKAPEAIRGDLQVLANAVAIYADALKGVDLKAGATPSPDVLAKLQAAVQKVDQSAVAAASQHMTAWVAAHCHA